MLLDSIESYYKSNVYKPFYASVGDNEYLDIKKKLAEAGDVEVVCLSNYCFEEDKKPDLDKLRETLRMADVDCQSNKILILGLGEFLAMEGTTRASQILEELITFNLGSAHAVFLLRGVTQQVKKISSDPRMSERQIAFGDESDTEISLMCSSLELKMYECNGFRNALKQIEDGGKKKICFNSSLEFPNSLLPIKKVYKPYDAICKVDVDFSIPKAIGSEGNWTDLLVEVTEKRSVNKVFDAHEFDLSLTDFYQRITDSEYISWLYFIYLYKNAESISNKYLKLVASDSKGLDDFRNKVLNKISEIPSKDSRYDELYSDRKSLVKDYPESDIAAFVANNRFDVKESIYRLTDNTLVEREEIIANISQQGMPDKLEKLYPDLYMYLKKYHFTGTHISDLLTEYFDKYKKQKVTNKLEDSFVEQVNELAAERVYNRLRTRDEIVSAIDTSSAFLCWIDALGVEYLSYINEQAQKRGLAVSVEVGRAELPTITSINKKFYDLWPAEHKRKIEDLDDVKHHEKGGYKYGPSNKYPIHLAKELEIITNAINEAATDLGLRKYDRYVIASDHGASRLAVLRNKEEKYETDTQGEHSGRCCKSFEGYDLEYATEENGYVVLADYGRFKGSRAANVEVHGGAALEEVLVPIIRKVSSSLLFSYIIIRGAIRSLQSSLKRNKISIR